MTKGNFLKKHMKENATAETQKPRRRKTDTAASKRPSKPKNFKRCTIEMDRKNKYLEIRALATIESFSMWEVYDVLNDYCLANWNDIKKDITHKRKNR